MHRNFILRKRENVSVRHSPTFIPETMLIYILCMLLLTLLTKLSEIFYQVLRKQFKSYRPASSVIANKEVSNIFVIIEHRLYIIVELIQ